ncbi:MAG: T9SS type A sorting domain-containing protein [Saprospiraceae bacterium]|nr:T9SS type A sorting domain-containing protein [Saprospiraceae bacterium]
MKRRMQLFRAAIKAYLLSPSLVLFAFLFSTSLYSQVDVISSGGTPMASYTTLSAAFLAINSGTHTGTITVNITANTTEPVSGAILNASGAGAADYTSILVKPSGGAARTISGAATAGLALVQLNGADNVTFDGLNTGGNSLTIVNTTVSATSGTSTIHLQTDATFNIFTNLTVNGSGTMPVGTNGGNFWFGASSTSTGQDNNLISNCKIGPNGTNWNSKGIYSNGTSTTFNNSDNVVTNCEIFDYFGVTTQSAGIYITTASSAWTITNNKFYQTVSKTQTTGAIHAAIQIGSTNVDGCVITGNTIGYANAAGTGNYMYVGASTSSRMVGIYLSSHGTANKTIISNNFIQNISLSGILGTTTTTSAFIGIQISSGWADCNNNTVGSSDGSKTILITNSNTSTSEVYGIYSSVSIAGVTTEFNNNIIGAITHAQTGTAACGLIGLRAGNSTTNDLRIENNIIGGTGAELKTMNTSTTASLNGNSVIGIYIQTSPSQVLNNVISNLTTNNQSTGTATTASIHGIYVSSAATGANVSGNTIHTLSNTSPSANSWVNGITISTSTATLQVEKNFIHSLNISGTGTTATLNGIYINGGTTDFINNMIRLGITSGGTSITSGLAINGFNEVGGTVNRFYHNSVFIGGTGVATLSNATYAFSSTRTSGTREYLNNIFYNARSNGAGTGKHYAIRAGGTGVNPAGLLSNYNDLFVNGTGGFVGFYDLADRLTLSDWKTATGQDCNSVSGNPQFVNPTGTSSTVDLHISGAATPIERAAFPLALVTMDYDMQTRASFTPSDIGADAGNFAVLDMSGPIINVTPLEGICGTADTMVMNVNITDATGVPTMGSLVPRLYYRKNLGAWTSTAGVLTSGTGTNGNWKFTFVMANVGGVVIGDVIDYYFIAQDIAGPNISSNPACAVATDVNTVITVPSSLYSVAVKASLNGTYTVGVGGDFTTLTAAVTAYNNACLVGPVVFMLIDASYPSETFPISINQVPGQSSVNTLTIRPAAGNTATLSGSSTTSIIKLNGADWVILDGSNSGGTDQNWTIWNTSTGTSTAAIWVSSLGTGMGATNNTIKNCWVAAGSITVTSTFAIHVGGITISTAGIGDDNDNLTIQNNSLWRAYYGVYSRASSTGKNDNTRIIKNLIGSDIPTDQIGKYGIQIYESEDALIEENSIIKIVGSITNPTAIRVETGVTNSLISKNRIRNIEYNGTGGYGGKGIDVAAQANANLTIANNFISKLRGDGWSTITSDAIVGIRILTPSTGINVYHNTVVLDATISRSSTADISAAIYFHSAAAALNVKNNIFINKLDNITGTAKAYSIFSDAPASAFNTIDNNNYFVGGPEGVFGRIPGAVDVLDLAAWKSFTGKDILSLNLDPVFVDSTDLHLTTNAANTCLNQSAMVIPGITMDIDNQTRSLSNPDIGADEFNPGGNLTIAVTETSGTPNDKFICSGSAGTLTVTGGSTHKWSTGETTSAITKAPLTTTIYNDTVTLAAGCKVVMFDTLKVLPSPNAAVVPPAATICSGSSIILTATGGTSFLWNTGSTSASINVSPAMTTTYTVTVTAPNGCTGLATSTVTVLSAPVAAISPAAPTLCSGSSQMLTASGGGTYEWSTGSTNASITVNPGSTTTYTVTVTGGNGCTDTETVTVSVITGVGITQTIVQPSDCFTEDGSIDVSVSGVSPFTYNWFTPDGSGLINGQQDQPALSVGSYLLTVTSTGNGCSSTKAYSLTGPGNCGTCPSVNSLIKSVSTVCKTTTFTLTANVAGMGTLYGVLFKYSTVALPNPYSGGTTLGIVPNAGLTGGGTMAVLNTSIPLQGDYFIYAILSPTPISPACRPFASNTIKVLKCEPEITDPCSCKNNATTLTNGQFNETITINAPSGQVWIKTNSTGLYLSSSPAPPAAPIAIPNGTALTEVVLGGGVSNYVLTGVHVDALGYTATFSNGNITQPIGNTCYYPNPSIVGLANTYCANDPSVPLVGNAQLGDGSGPAMGTGSFTINGNAATVFNPAALGAGTHLVVFTFDAADGVPNPQHPGCIQSVSQSVVVNPVPTVNAVTNRFLCVGQTSTAIVFTGSPAGTVFNWTRTPEAIGLAVTSGSGSVPAFVGTNAGTTPLTSTFTVTPVFANSGRSCPGTPITFTITVNPTPTVNAIPDVQYCHGDVTAIINFTGNVPGAVYNWTRTPEPIGLAATNGSNSVPSFVTTNPSAARITSTFTVTPSFTNGGVTCTGSPITFRISVLPQPVARCRDITVYLDDNGMVSITTADVDNGSTAATLSLSKTDFNCGNTGPNNVLLTARDSCGKSSTCTSVVTVLDTIAPVFWCPKDWTVNLDPGECNRAINFDDPEATDNCTVVSSTANGAITTTFASNNQFAGAMFNLTNISTGVITINSIATNISAAVGTNVIVQVYYTPTTYIGKETNAALWTLLGTGNAPCAGLNQPTLFNIGGLALNPGQAYGIYVHLVNYTAGAIAFRYTNGTNTYNNGDLSLFAGVGKATPAFTGATFASRIFNGTLNYTKNVIIGADPTVTQIDNSGYKNGDFFPRGTTCLSYRATDFSGNSSVCSFCITLNEYTNPNSELACNDEIQVSLDENCSATIGADELLSGGPYRCFDDYRIIVQDWITGQVIDRNPNLRGSQVGIQDIGREFKVTVIDTITGNSCWGHAVVEDKIAPQLICARDTCVPCGSTLTTPFYMGTPTVIENCGGASLSYADKVEQGGCGFDFEERITRTWVAVDASGNRNVCVQVITVAIATLADVDVPLNYDDIEEPSLSCDGKIDTTKDYSAHYLPSPYCVDGYLLDSAHWFATGGYLPSPNGDLAGERLPRTLGWNCLDTGRYIGHPSPWPVYWPAHPSWRPNNPLCWGPDEVVMWQGTGYPSASDCSNLGITFNDVRINTAAPNCDAGEVGCFKIIRQWTVLDWCAGSVGGHNQIIKVIDREGPQILYPDTVTVNMDPWNCVGIWEVPKPWLLDNCSNELHYSLEINSGTITGNETDGYVIVNIERGLNEAFIVAEDCCGNITKRRIAFNVPDNTPPIAVCDQRTIVSLTGNQSPNDNFGKVFAKDLDQGSFDNCSPHVFFKVIRMEQLRGTNNGSNANQSDNGTNCAGVNGDDNAVLEGNQIYFDDHVKFCCSDVGRSIMVVFRVFDVETGAGPIAPARMNPGGNLFNHFTDCMIEVEVQDKSVPTVVAPPNIVVSCWFWFDVDNLDDPNDPTFGRVVNDLTERRKVVTKDLVCYNYCLRNDITGYPGFVPGAPPSNPPAWNRACQYYQELFDTAHADRKHELTWGFDGMVLNACGTNFSISVNDNRECGQGQLTRTVVARGPNGISVTATQTIWVVDCDPFYINRDDNCDSDDDITWPGNCTGQATTIAGCGADISPDNPLLGRPTVENNADDLCALISIEYTDEIFTIEPDACFKVLRTWVVIDWCQYDPSLDPLNGRWEYLQIIKVTDTDKPTVTIAFGDPCQPAVKNPVDNICYAPVVVTASATDNCSPLDWLFYDYKIDLYNDGIGQHSGYDLAVGPLTQKDFAAGKRPVKNHNPLADNPNDPFNASGNYPVGIHKFCWFVEDGCGNISSRCEVFEVTDCKAPTPYCHVGAITTIMPTSGCITIWAKDLDAGSFDNCTPAGDLRIYFGDFDSDSLTICCDDFVSNRIDDELIIPVIICVEDQEGNKDCCETTIIILDSKDTCPNGGSFGRITGELMTLNNEGTENVEVELLDSRIMMKQMKTVNDGKYLFGDLPVGLAKEYVVKPARTDDPLNGVSTADIVKIQRHILGIESLNSSYKLIAADVNESKTITAADVSEIRKLILGVINEFGKTESWTFVPSEYVFPDPAQPWNAPREVTVPLPTPVKVTQDFIAIKMGDVTNNARGHHVQGSTTRFNGKLNLEIENNSTVAGELYRVEFKSSNFTNISGYQFTLRFDGQALSFEGVEAGVLNVDESNFGTNRINEGILTTSWNNKVAQSADADVTLFTVVFRASGQTNIGSLLAITSDVTSAEAYDASLNIRDVNLGVRTERGVVESGVFELYQNSPNPFVKETVISYRLPEAGAVKLTIYDVTGKVLRVYETQGAKGLNTMKVQKSDLNTGGVLYYQLDALNHTATKRMVIIE